MQTRKDVPRDLRLLVNVLKVSSRDSIDSIAFRAPVESVEAVGGLVLVVEEEMIRSTSAISGILGISMACSSKTRLFLHATHSGPDGG